MRHGDDFKQYVEQLRSKSATYKKMKTEIDELAAEHGVLLRTQELLEQQLSSAIECARQNAVTPAGESISLKMQLIKVNAKAKAKAFHSGLSTVFRIIKVQSCVGLALEKPGELVTEVCFWSDHYFNLGQFFKTNLFSPWREGPQKSQRKPPRGQQTEARATENFKISDMPLFSNALLFRIIFTKEPWLSSLSSSGETGPAETKREAENLKEVLAEVKTAVTERRCNLTPQVEELKLLQAELLELEEHAGRKQNCSEVQSLFERYRLAKLD